ncbi:hypothetical protein [Aliiglaciecola litoralis]|uniref:WD40-like Beta Propeller Repeat n=1 Tax=Aliiglaciecola litoralis TaxID=582857 RepID=A0ABN1LDU5_9ALTE
MIKLKISIGLCVFAMLIGQAYGQSAPPSEPKKVDFPHTDIFLFDLDLTNSQQPLSQGKNATQRQGYDNQPYFTPDSQSFLFSRGDDYQTDVYEYALGTGEITQITDSPATEFSPTPSNNNQKIAFVSDRNGGIWLADRADANHPKWLLESIDNREPVGYFALNHDSKDLLYWSRYGYAMILANVQTGSYHYVSGNTPPATPHIIPNTNRFSFVHRQGNGQVWIKELDPNSKAIRPLIMVNGPNHNYAWAPDGSILMIQNDVLYRALPEQGQQWITLADLNALRIKQANRIAISPDGKKLAVVGQSAK